jgi:AcrR family transcriptional regulator
MMATTANHSADRRLQIIDTALQLFAVHGVAGTSMRALADAVGIKAASLYNHFGSKDEIIDAVVERGVRTFERLEAHHASQGDLGATETLRSCIEFWLRQCDENQDIVLIFSREPLLLDPARNREFSESTKVMIAFFERLIEHGIRAGELSTDDPHLVAFDIWGLGLAWILRGELLDRPSTVEEYARRQAELVIRQIRADARMEEER